MAMQAGRKGVKRDQVDLYGNVKPPEYELPIASADKLGGVKVGQNLNVSSDGTLSTHAPYELPTASADVKGGVKIGSGININDGVISNGYVLPMATDDALGGVIVGNGLTVNNGVLSVASEQSYIMNYQGTKQYSSGWNTINTDLYLDAGQYLAIASFELETMADVCVRSNVGSFSGGYGAGTSASGLATPLDKHSVQYTDVITISSDNTRLSYYMYVTANSYSDTYPFYVTVIPLAKVAGLQTVYSGTPSVSVGTSDWGSTTLTTLNRGKYLFLARVGTVSGQDCSAKFSFNDEALNSITATGRSSTSTNSLGIMILWIKEFTEDNNAVALNVMATPTSGINCTVRIFKLSD